MIKSAIYHRATDSFCYSPDGKSLVVRLQSAADDIVSIHLWTGDPHDWVRQPNVSSNLWYWRCASIPMQKIASNGIHDFWEVSWIPPYKRARYFFRITFTDGSQYDYGEKGLLPTCEESKSGPTGDYQNTFVFPYINQVDVFKAPDWVAKTVWYQIFPERFRNGNKANDPLNTVPWKRGTVTNNEWYGGDLRGIIDSLDYIANLGCNGIYLTPIFASPSVHKYDTEDYFMIDPVFGSDDDLSILVQACHKRGIRIMLDAVFNHCGKTFAPWMDVIKNGEASLYKDWFHITGFPLYPKGSDTGDSRDANFETFSFTTRMPKFNTANPSVRAYLLKVAEHYINKFDIDGWRLDVSNEIDHVFWREFRTKVKALKQDIYIVGEVWHDAMPWLRGDQYDAVMNYLFANAITDFLLVKPYMQTAKDFVHRIAELSFKYPDMVLRVSFNLLDSHDTDRLVSRLGGQDLAKLALTLLFVLPGSPCIYYGTEYALEGGTDPDNRRCMIWEPTADERAFAGFVASLIAVRRQYWKLFAFGMRQYYTDTAYPGLLGIKITDAVNTLLVFINRSKYSIKIKALEENFFQWNGVHAQSLLEEMDCNAITEIGAFHSMILQLS